MIYITSPGQPRIPYLDVILKITGFNNFCIILVQTLCSLVRRRVFLKMKAFYFYVFFCECYQYKTINTGNPSRLERIGENVFDFLFAWGSEWAFPGTKEVTKIFAFLNQVYGLVSQFKLTKISCLLSHN